jgi:hypothetical protein
MEGLKTLAVGLEMHNAESCASKFWSVFLGIIATIIFAAKSIEHLGRRNRGEYAANPNAARTLRYDEIIPPHIHSSGKGV